MQRNSGRGLLDIGPVRPPSFAAFRRGLRLDLQTLAMDEHWPIESPTAPRRFIYTPRDSERALSCIDAVCPPTPSVIRRNSTLSPLLAGGCACGRAESEIADRGPTRHPPLSQPRTAALGHGTYTRNRSRRGPRRNPVAPPAPRRVGAPIMNCFARDERRSPHDAISAIREGLACHLRTMSCAPASNRPPSLVAVSPRRAARSVLCHAQGACAYEVLARSEKNHTAACWAVGFRCFRIESLPATRQCIAARCRLLDPSGNAIVPLARLHSGGH
ncbi:hypothetical protein C2E23DRAFT_626355 [Lenzites betulinus]|nr:hypothetical protein C2E23DRAFT_626355 [Lenzites betulinus]